MKETKYFTLYELLHSETARSKGLDNTPSFDVVDNLNRLVTTILDPVRAVMGVPIKVNSGYRSQAVNKAVGGVKDSQHIQGLAADIVCSDMKRLITVIKNNGKYDQLILEHCKGSTNYWVHVSIAPKGNKPRNQFISNLEKK